MYEMLAFKEPFRGRVIRETFDNIVHVTPPSPREIRPERNIPESLVHIVFKALEKKNRRPIPHNLRNGGSSSQDTERSWLTDLAGDILKEIVE